MSIEQLLVELVHFWISSFHFWGLIRGSARRQWRWPPKIPTKNQSIIGMVNDSQIPDVIGEKNVIMKDSRGINVGFSTISMYILTFVSFCPRSTPILYRIIHTFIAYTQCIKTYLRLCSTRLTQSTCWTLWHQLSNDYACIGKQNSV